MNKDKHIHVRVSAKFKNEIEKIAEAKKTTVSKLIYECLAKIIEKNAELIFKN